MARSKKSDDKSNDSANHQISIEDFIRIRDSLITGLTNIQTAFGSAVQQLTKEYMAHTNTVVGKTPSSSLELLSFSNPLGIDNVLFGGRTATPGPTAEVVEAKKRKRAPHDKNAPKRPMTPYFLYMHTARSLIAGEMEPSHSAKEVADEGTRRWNDMPAEERELWNYKYAVNFTRYKEKVKAYKAGLPIPEISDAEAKRLYEEQKRVGIIHEPTPNDIGHKEEQLDSETSDDDVSSSSDEESPEPLKVPSPPKSPRSSKRRKGMKDVTDRYASITKPIAVKEVQPVATPEVGRISKSPEKGRKKKGTRKRDAKDSGEPLESKREFIIPIARSPRVSVQDTQAKQKRSKKKRKSEAADA